MKEMLSKHLNLLRRSVINHDSVWVKDRMKDIK